MQLTWKVIDFESSVECAGVGTLVVDRNTRPHHARSVQTSMDISHSRSNLVKRISSLAISTRLLGLVDSDLPVEVDSFGHTGSGSWRRGGLNCRGSFGKQIIALVLLLFLFFLLAFFARFVRFPLTIPRRVTLLV
jgi:hypothetical protein